MFKKIILSSTLLGAVGALMIVYSTTPATIHPIGLLVFFLCIYAVTLGLITGMMYVLQQIYIRLSRRAVQSSLLTAYEYSTVIALGPVILLALQTVGRLQLADVVFTALFVALGCAYIAKRRR